MQNIFRFQLLNLFRDIERRWMNMQDSNRLSVATAARLMGASEQFIRVGLQQKELPFGFAIKMSGQWTYVITKQKFEEHTGIKVKEG